MAAFAVAAVHCTAGLSARGVPVAASLFFRTFSKATVASARTLLPGSLKAELAQPNDWRCAVVCVQECP